VILLLNLLILNLNIIFEQDVKDYSDLLQKGDSSLSVQDYSSAVQFYSQIEGESVYFNSDKARLTFYLNFSDALYTIGDYPDALVKYERLKFLAKQKQDNFFQGKAHIGIAHSLWRMAENVRSIEEILAGIEIFRELKDTSNLITASNILAGIYVGIGNYSDAEGIYNEMLEIAVKSGDSTNIATNYEYLGVIDYFNGNYQDAIRNYRKSLAINIKTENAFARAINLSNMAEAYMELGEFRKGLNILHEATAVQEEYNFKSVLIFSYLTIGRIYTELASYDSAMYNYEKSLALMDQTSETREKHEVYRLIACNYEKQRDFQKAYYYHQKYTARKDSMINSARTRQLEEIRTRYEVENKIKENQDLLYQNSKIEEELSVHKDMIQLQNMVGVLISIFLVISVFLAYRLYRVRKTLINANRSKDKLFGIIAHDLKGPIGNIGAMLNMLQLEKDEKRKAQYLNYLMQSVSNLSALTNQLLSWTFSHKGDFNFEIQKLSVREMSDRSIELFEYQLSEKRIKIINSISSELYVMADENALLTIFRNILSNAVKFTKLNGNITLEADEKKRYIEIRIKDSGVGISRPSIERILEGSHVVSSAGTANEKGSGLGFSIVMEFVRKLKGDIDIESDGKNGTEVFLKLLKA